MLVVLLSGCSEHPFGGGNAEELASEARSLLPPDARVISQGGGDCVELADYPSCWTLTFESNLRQEERVAAVEASAADADWESRGQSRTQVSTWLQFEKGHFFATVILYFPDCPKGLRARCTDTVRVLD